MEDDVRAFNCNDDKPGAKGAMETNRDNKSREKEKLLSYQIGRGGGVPGAGQTGSLDPKRTGFLKPFQGPISLIIVKVGRDHETN